MMTQTKGLIIGAGSIGLRHAEVLKSMGVDTAFVTARCDIEEVCFTDILTALRDFTPNYVVIATPTSEHLNNLISLSEAGFSEKVLIEKPAELQGLNLESLGFSDVRVAFNLRFHPVIHSLKALLSEVVVYSVEAYAGQSLESWRPGRETSSTYSSHKSKGGGVLRDLSHELDYLTLLFGKWESLVSLGGRIGHVTVDSDDSWSIIATTSLAPQLSLQLNYFDQPGQRTITVNTSEGTVTADIVKNELIVSGLTTAFDVEKNTTYIEMHRNYINSSSVLLCSADESTEIDTLIEDIEQSSLLRKWVDR